MLVKAVQEGNAMWAVGAAPEAGSGGLDGQGLRTPPHYMGPQEEQNRAAPPHTGGTLGPSGESLWRGTVWAVMGMAGCRQAARRV